MYSGYSAILRLACYEYGKWHKPSSWHQELLEELVAKGFAGVAGQHWTLKPHAEQVIEGLQFALTALCGDKIAGPSRLL